jgi:hypothetical protein
MVKAQVLDTDKGVAKDMDMDMDTATETDMVMEELPLATEVEVLMATETDMVAVKEVVE